MNINREVLQANKAAADTMTSVTKSMGKFRVLNCRCHVPRAHPLRRTSSHPPRTGGVDAVEETMDAVEEGLVDADEIGQALGRSIAMPGLDADEDDMLAELEALEQDELDRQLQDVSIGSSAQASSGSNTRSPPHTRPFPHRSISPAPLPHPVQASDEAELARMMPSAPVSMPSAPTTAVKPAMTEEERELAELEASMAM
mgnify:CR=1 FL=1